MNRNTAWAGFALGTFAAVLTHKYLANSRAPPAVSNPPNDGAFVKPPKRIVSSACEVPIETELKERAEPERLFVKPFIPGESKILASHSSDPDAPKLEIVVSNDDLQYDLRPKYIPNPDGGEPVIYLDAQDPTFYARPVPDPILHVWILIKNTRWQGEGYVKRRLAEEMRRQRIAYRLVHPMKCDLLLSKEGLEEIVVGGERLPLPDCAIPRVGASVDYFGLAIMRQLEVDLAANAVICSSSLAMLQTGAGRAHVQSIALNRD